MMREMGFFKKMEKHNKTVNHTLRKLNVPQFQYDIFEASNIFIEFFLTNYIINLVTLCQTRNDNHRLIPTVD